MQSFHLNNSMVDVIMFNAFLVTNLMLAINKWFNAF